jgi:ribonuclease HI
MNQTITTPNSALNISSDGADPILIYVDGAGCRPDGKGSGFAWIHPSSGEQHIEQIDGLTNNQAEYRALISALVALPNGSSAQIFTDSQVMWSQVIGKYRVHHPELADLLLQVRTTIKQKSLNIDLKWVPRNRNLAGKLL